MQPSPSNSGFTLLELLTVLAIIAVITSFGIPYYTQYMLKARRLDATISLIALQAPLETYYAQHQAYPLRLPAPQTTSKEGHYTIILSQPSGKDTYLLTALATDLQKKDLYCQKIHITHNGIRSGTNHLGALSTVCW
jgi:type IV pilus assembly protein PilE